MSDDPKLEWMYKNSSKIVDREEYLLGRRIDKTFESTNDEHSNKESFGFSFPPQVESNNPIDALRKIKEDPLEAIREKERDMRKQLLKNPVQMKKLKTLLEKQKEQKLQKTKKEKKKKKTKRKKSKHKKYSSDDDDSSSESDNDTLNSLLAEKLKNLVQKHGIEKVMNIKEEGKNKKNKTNENTKRKKSKRSSSSSEESTDDSSSEEENSSSDSSHTRSKNKKYKEKSRKQKSDSRSGKRSKESSSSESSDSDKRKTKNITRKEVDKRDSKSKRRYESDDSDSDGYVKSRGKSKIEENKGRSYSHQKRSRSRSPHSRKFGLSVPRGAVKSKYNPQREKEVADSKRVQTSVKKPEKNKLSKNDKEKKLKEMMENASWRNDLREANVKRYREDDERERKNEKEYDEHFTKRELSKAAYTDSVERRIKSNVHNIQRSTFAMEKNFARR